MLRCLAVVLPMATAAAQAPAFLTNGLVAYYPFNTTANDESGNGKHGQVIGVQFSTNRFGRNASSADFSGNAAYVKLPELSANLGQPRSSFTATLWVRPIANGANVFLSATTDNSYQFCRIGCRDDFRLYIYHRANGKNNEAAGLIQLNPDVWNLVRPPEGAQFSAEAASSPAKQSMKWPLMYYSTSWCHPPAWLSAYDPIPLALDWQLPRDRALGSQ